MTDRTEEAQTETPHPTEGTSFSNEQNQTFIVRLTSQYSEVYQKPGGAAVPSPPILLANLVDYEVSINNAHSFFSNQSQNELIPTYASEWVLDNFYIIRQAIRQIKEDLPRGYYRQLPKLVKAPLESYPRIYAVSREILFHFGLVVNEDRLLDMLRVFQEQTALTMGEVWAVPIFLRFALIEALAHTLNRVVPENLRRHTPLSISIPHLNEDEIVANAITGLRAISDLDWNNFFETVSLIEQRLRSDPAEIYPLMDFKTRDFYRGTIEELALDSHLEENTITQAALDLAGEARSDDHGLESSAQRDESKEGEIAWRNPKVHVGYYLVGDGRQVLEKRLGFVPGRRTRLRRWIQTNPTPIYLSAISLLATIFILLPSIVSLPLANDPLMFFIVPLFLLIPALSVSISLVNWIITTLVPPTIFPKLDLQEFIPRPFETLVVIPALLTNREEVESLVRQLELHYLRNPQNGLHFGLLTDFGDAKEEILPDDGELTNLAADLIENLNQKYSLPGRPSPFYLFHRRRQWNQKEKTWMGWERKRGKLHELNRLLHQVRRSSGVAGLSFLRFAGDLDLLRAVNYVITLDADTILPNGAAAHLVGTMAHPLNQPILNKDGSEVLSGYTILQPRMEINPSSANRSRFTQIFAGDAGLDLYSLAVSDAYQDFFGEGIYVGKGIYDVDAYERTTNGRIPDNMLLSHDLLEGLFGRAGLVTDITMIEDYPEHYILYALRQHRWVRGDWQLLPWLFNPTRYNAKLSTIDRWKVIDNLRRSLLSLSLVALLILGALFFPGPSWIWPAVILLTPGVSVLTGLVRGVVELIHGEPALRTFHPLRMALLRWLLSVVFMVYEAYLALDAILTTLYRVLVSRRRLLQWTTTAHTVQLFRENGTHKSAVREMIPTFLFSLAASTIIYLLHPAALPAAGPVLVLWILSLPLIGWVEKPLTQKEVPLSQEQEQLLRLIARRTWSFFEHFAGPEDHWLPPDHYQESPLGIVAHRTSPTNIGLLLTSTLAACDLGYTDQLNLLARLSATFDTLSRLERYRGHLLNWYDTQTLQPLKPGYVSTVDSGNLAACLIITARTCEAMKSMHVFRWQRWEGYLDTLAILEDTLSRLILPGITVPTLPILDQLAGLRRRIENIRYHPENWYDLFTQITSEIWPGLSISILHLIEGGRSSFSMESLRSLQQVSAQVEANHKAAQRTIHELVPWIPLLENLPEMLQNPEGRLREILHELRAGLPYSPTLETIRELPQKVAIIINELRSLVNAARNPGGDPETSAVIEETLIWLEELDNKLQDAAANINFLLIGYMRISQQADRMVEEMDFSFLYNAQRRVFHIGYNLDASQLDNNFYDLLASEARIASLIAIARGQVPGKHWLQLSRPVTQVNNQRVLLSWSATMFEYLMPPLFLKSYKGTLLDESARGAIEQQIRYARGKGLPWGISESGFFRFDPNQSYQYRAFGVPGLGFKRGLSDDLVIAPYASLIGLPLNSQEVCNNITNLVEKGLLGLYGFYEAIDFTPDRLPVGQEYAIVREYMSHHHGMTMMALANYFHNNIMAERMHTDPYIRSVELLLQEQIPLSAPTLRPDMDVVKGPQRVVQGSVDLTAWPVPTLTSIPQMHLLANGSYSVMIDNAGAGYSEWRELELTRWQPDRASDCWGTWIYIQDLDQDPRQDGLWSAGYQPIPGNPGDFQVTYFHHMAVFRRARNGIISTMEITVPPDHALEVRRLNLTNATDRPRRLRLTSYGEVILTSQAADARHPAFNKMFIESEYVPDQNLLVFWRRPRSGSETPVFLGHTLVIATNTASSAGLSNQVRYETDRLQFIGRGQSLRKPQALSSETYLTGSVGATLDPIFSIGQEILLAPRESVQVAFLTFAASSRPELLALAQRYNTWHMIDRVFDQADIANQTWLTQHNIDSRQLQDIMQVLSALVFPSRETRSDSETLAANRLGQSGLWRFGLSGDYPILLVRLDDPNQINLVQAALDVHRYLRIRRVKIDLVILNQQHTGYGAELFGILYRLLGRVNSDQWMNQRGGIFVLHADQMHQDELVLFETAARLILDGEKENLSSQLPGYTIQVPQLPDFIPTLPATETIQTVADPLGPVSELQFKNGFGGFSQDGREYIIELSPGRQTPVPWTNVIGYHGFGFLVTESGSSHTWALNSGENRLSPWSNDPVLDPTGEALYLRDEETGEVWSPTPLPSGGPHSYRIRHGAGYSIFEHNSHGLYQELRLFAAPDEPVKIIQLRVENTLNRPRRITATQYIEWVLGTTRQVTGQYIIPEYDTAHECLLASNPFSAEFGQRVAFLATSRSIHGLTADRTEFFGRNGSLAEPAALRRIGLQARITPGEDPCAVLQVYLDLPPGHSDEIYFLIGQGENRQHSLALVERFHNPDQVAKVWQQVGEFWDKLLGKLQVHTPDPATDLLLNRWLLYQALSCRIWGRTAFYQSSGAYGFRDQLQDVLSILNTTPVIARAHILEAARHQFEEGDVLHWWHPPSGRGIRTRFSDDLLWLPFVVSRYLEVTDDWDFLDEQVPFLLGPPLNEDEDELYGKFDLTHQSFTLFEHCHRAIERGSTRGSHGLPLMGTGDWNDGMNRVGEKGHGESVWLAWFLYDVLQRFARVCDQRGEVKMARDYRSRAHKLADAIEKIAWDGSWYQRAYFDDGTPLGSHLNEECKIDSIAQSWSVLSGAGSPERTQLAMKSVLENLVHLEDRLILLFTPPFNRTEKDPGYIKGYLPGIRENGGQYTHAAIWTVWAFAQMGDGQLTGELFNLLNPIYQADTENKAIQYRVEPYVIAADIYSVPPYVRRGGWTWYTGSSSWMYQLGINAFLGFQKSGNRVRLQPAIPATWEKYELTYRYGRSDYHFMVYGPQGTEKGVREMRLDGQPVEGDWLILEDDGDSHTVDVWLS